MNISDFLPMKILIVFFSITFFSCSIDQMDDNDAQDNIDLTLVEENNWDMSNDILTLINNHRLEIGKSPLIKDTLYATAYAVKHSKYMMEIEMVNHNDFFSRSNGLKSKGATSVSENIAYGYSSAHSVMNAWVTSENHNQNIIGDFTHIGFGVIKGRSNKYYYTTLFYK